MEHTSSFAPHDNWFLLGLILGLPLYGAFFIVLANTLVDIAYAGLDPRVRPA